MLLQSRPIPKLLRIHSPHDLLCLADKLIELLVRADIKPTEPVEELRDIRDRRVTKDLRGSVLFSA
jgi:hypothetical protein